jgi:beta-N-acetylhexosaminidase
MAQRAFITGLSGLSLTADERAFLREARPWGLILFKRNIDSKAQVSEIVREALHELGADAPVLIDQEGGRVARLRGPAWREWPPALEECRRLPTREARARAMRRRYQAIADELRGVGIDVNCAPVLDLARSETHAVIRDRCYGDDPAEVAAIGRAVADGLLAGGVLPVNKHVPGHGRATLDSHLALPEVRAGRAELDADVAPFRALADLPMAMTAHVVYPALDPGAPATQSAAVVRLIREEIGFDGLLMTDDLSMRALRGGFAERASRALAAGCDVVLHCNGDASEMAEVASAVPELAGAAARRAEAALALRGAAAPGRAAHA